jgi:hypothetical protein
LLSVGKYCNIGLNQIIQAMKKLTFSFILLLLFCFSSFGQNAVSLQDIYGENIQGREIGDLTCPPGSIYSQLPDGINGWTGNFGYIFYDNVLSVTGSAATSVTFFLIESIEYEPLYMDIIIKGDNAGVPGNIKYAFYNVPVNKVATGETSFGFPVFTYTYTFPSPINIVVGDWVGYYAYPITGGGFADAHHYWMTSSDGDGESYFDETSLVLYLNDFSFCLGYESGPADIPLSGWAIAIGIALIVASTIIRYRRIA